MDKIQKNRIFFRETFSNQVVYRGTFTSDDQSDDDDEPKSGCQGTFIFQPDHTASIVVPADIRTGFVDGRVLYL